MKKTIIAFFLIYCSLNSLCQNEIKAASMVFRYELFEDSIYCFLSAPTKGWIMVGFNSINSTENADFKFFSVRKGKCLAEDRINIGGRNYPLDDFNNGQQNINVNYGKEKNNTTLVSFNLPLRTRDHNDFQHQFDKPFYLILSYSQEDDFQHHSIFRKHIIHKWIKP